MPSSFPLNAWYAAAWDVDLKHALFPRTICGKHVVMYRQSNGRSARWRTPAGTGWCRCRRDGSMATRSSAAITG